MRPAHYCSASRCWVAGSTFATGFTSGRPWWATGPFQATSDGGNSLASIPLAYYTEFGAALRHPFFAGYASFWDGIYSTLWGDGLAAGMVRLATRHAHWNYEFMTLAYALALPASLLIFVGFGRATFQALTDVDLGRRCALSLITTVLYVVGLALLAITLSLPYYAQAKAFYAIATLVPVALVGALGPRGHTEMVG